MKTASYGCHRALLPVSLALAALLQPALAATHTWTGPAGGQWSNPANWTGGVPTTGEAGGTIVSFGSGTTSVANISGLVVDQIHFSGGGNTINGALGSSLSLSGSVQTENIWSVTGTNTFASSLNLNYVNIPTCFVRVDAGTLNMAATTGGTTGIRKRGAGTMVISAVTNTNTGNTSVSEGVLSLNSSGDDTAVVGNIIVGTGAGTPATLSLAQSSQIKDTATVTVGSDGTFNTNGLVESIAGLTVNGGDVNHAGANLVVGGPLSMAGGTITGTTGIMLLQGDVTATSSATETATIASRVTLIGTRIFTVNDGAQATDLNLSNLIGGGGLTKSGPGNLLMSTATSNTYTGGTTVNQGLLTLNGAAAAVIPGALVIGSGSGAAGSAIVRLGQGNEIHSNSAVSVKVDGILDLNNFNETVASLAIDRGSVTIGTGSFYAPLGINMTGGLISSTGGVLNLSGDVTATSTADSTATIEGNVALTGTRNITVNPGGSEPHFVINALVSEVPAASGFGITKLGNGVMNLTGGNTNTFTGTTTVSKGVLQLKQTTGRTIVGPVVIGNGVDPAGSAILRELIQNDIQSTVAVTVNKSGILDMNGFGDTIDTLSGEGSVVLPAASVLTLGGNNGSSNFVGNIGGTGQFRKTGVGTVTLGGKLISVLDRIIAIDGPLVLNLGAGSLFPGVLQVGDGGGAAGSATVRLGNTNQLAPAGTVEVRSDGLLDNEGWSAATGTLTISGGLIALDPGSALSVATQMNMTAGSVTGTGTLTLNGNLTATSSPAGVGAYINSKLALNGHRSFAVNTGGGALDLVVNGVVSNGPSGNGGFTKSGTGTLRLTGSPNTYSGLTTVDRGVMEVEGGGSVAVPGALVIGNNTDAANSAIVKNLAANNLATTSQVTIGASGKLDLANLPERCGGLTGAGPVSLGSATLTIYGSPEMTYDGLISGTGGVVKNGAGTQIFTQNHTYSGGTTATSGKLVINGTQSGIFSVGATGTLGGLGIIAPSLNASVAGAKVAPGSGSGSSPGVFRVTGSANLNNAKLAVRLNDVTVLKSDQLIVSNNLSITGASVLPIPIGPVAATPHVIATYGTSGGTLTGTFASVPPGVTVNYAYNDGISSNNIAITITNAWQAWQAGYELNPATTGLPDADPDKDQIPNGIEFVMGLDPTLLNAGTDLPVGTVSGGNYLFSFRRAGVAASYNPVVQTSTTMGGPGTWTNVVSGITVEPNFYGPGIDRVVASIPRAGKPKLFCRLKVDGL